MRGFVEDFQSPSRKPLQVTYCEHTLADSEADGVR